MAEMHSVKDIGVATPPIALGALDTPTSGNVRIDGNDIFRMNDEKLTIFRRRNIGFIFQAYNLIPELNIEQNITFPVLLDYKKPDKAYCGRNTNSPFLAGQARPSAPAVIGRAATACGDWPRFDYPPYVDTCGRADRQFG
jgi:ABC-type dipeptide/oligopeptide/nickel transport system ATPase component